MSKTCVKLCWGLVTLYKRRGGILNTLLKFPYNFVIDCSFIKGSVIISPSWMYHNLNNGNITGLVSMHFLAA